MNVMTFGIDFGSMLAALRHSFQGKNSREHFLWILSWPGNFYLGFVTHAPQTLQKPMVCLQMFLRFHQNTRFRRWRQHSEVLVLKTYEQLSRNLE